VSFDLDDGKVVPRLTNVRKLAAVTTYGGSRLRAALAGDPPRRVVTRVLRAVIGGFRPVNYLACYDMNRASAAKRGDFLRRVQREMAAF
jgi:putative NADPH-quinone reductase